MVVPLPQVLKIVKSVHLPPLVEASSLLTIGDAWSVAKTSVDEAVFWNNHF